MTIFAASYVALWLVTAVLGVAVFSLYRYHGTHLLTTSKGRVLQGPPIGERSKALSARSLNGLSLTIGAVIRSHKSFYGPRSTANFAQRQLSDSPSFLMRSRGPSSLLSYVAEPL
jgi:hypothetical protein